MKIILVFTFLLLACNIYGQPSIATSVPAAHERYGKKAGDLRFSTLSLALGKIMSNTVKSDTIRIFNQSDKNISLTLGKIPTHITATLFATLINPNGESWLAITYDAAKKNDFGFLIDRIELITNDTEQPRNILSVTASIQEYFSLLNLEDSLNAPKGLWSANSFDYGHIKAGDKISNYFIVINRGKKDLVIRKAKTNCGCIKSILSKSTMAAGDTSFIKVDFDSFGKEGKDSRSLFIYLNDPYKPEVKLELNGVIEK